MHATPPLPETLADGRYIMGEVLGQGGMAVVVTAYDRALGVDRAVKILVPGTAHRETVRRRLKAEARAMARLQHPNILAIHDVGVQGDLDYVVMDLAESSLQDTDPMPLQDAVGAIVQVLSALATAHAAGMVHRDVKPHNILLDKNGRALLADFGIALLSDDERRTRTGVAMGSIAYMPPEQRLDAARVGPQADLYATGATLYALLTGENPVDLFLADEDSPRWEPVPAEVRPILLKATRHKPEERWENAAEMAGALAELLDTTLAGTPAPVPRQQPGVAPATPSTERTPTLAAADEAMAFLAHNVTVQTGGLGLRPELQRAFTAELREPEPRDRRILTGAVLGVAALAILLCAGWNVADRWRSGPSQLSGPVVGPVGPEPVVLPEPDPDPDPIPEPVVDLVPEPAAPAPEPALTTPQPRAPRPDPGPITGPSGHWTGSMGGIVVALDLEIRGERATGTFTSKFGPNTQTAPVAGTWDASAGALSLADTNAETPSAARYELRLEGARLEGRVIREVGGVRTLALRKSD